MPCCALQEELPPYLDPLVLRLLALLQHGQRLVQEGALTAMASLADAAKGHFAKYYDQVRLRHTLCTGEPIPWTYHGQNEVPNTAAINACTRQHIIKIKQIDGHRLCRREGRRWPAYAFNGAALHTSFM